MNASSGTGFRGFEDGDEVQHVELAPGAADQLGDAIRPLESFSRVVSSPKVKVQ